MAIPAGAAAGVVEIVVAEAAAKGDIVMSGGLKVVAFVLATGEAKGEAEKMTVVGDVVVVVALAGNDSFVVMQLLGAGSLKQPRAALPGCIRGEPSEPPPVNRRSQATAMRRPHVVDLPLATAEGRMAIQMP